MNEFTGLYDIRDVRDADKNFILATFLRGLYHGDSWFSIMPRSVFMEKYHAVAEALVKGDKTTIKVACLKEDPDVVLGYSIMSPDFHTIHWCFVKSAWRRRGLAKSLLPKYPISCTHLTRLGQTLMSKLQGMIFNPFDIEA